jgi:hypothetical protein
MTVTPGTGQMNGGTSANTQILVGGGQGLANGSNGIPVGAAQSVFMGTYTESTRDRPRVLSKTVPLQTAYNSFYEWSPAEFNFFKAQAKAMGNNVEGWTMFSPTALSVWQQAVNSAAAYGAVNPGTPLTPYDVLQKSAEAGQLAGVGGATSSTVVNLTNVADAKRFVNDSLKTYLGRQATESELDNFLSTLNSVERENPLYSSQGQRSGGTNPQVVAEEFAQSRPDSAEFTAATQYSDWLMQTIQEDTTAGVASGL